MWFAPCQLRTVLERERERESLIGNNIHNGGSWALLCQCAIVSHEWESNWVPSK